MDFTSERILDDGVVERGFVLGEAAGVLWTPAATPDAAPAPLLLMGHPGGLEQMYPRLVARAKDAVARGFAAATLELLGSGGRVALPAVDQARIELRAAIQAGERPSEDVVERLILPLADQAVPEWQRAIDSLLELPGLRGPVGFSGGVIAIAIAIRLALAEPRIGAVGFFAGSFIPLSVIEEARGLSTPVHMLLQWDDAFNDRQLALDAFDTFASAEKTLNANVGGHTGVPQHASDDAAAFFARHLLGARG